MCPAFDVTSYGGHVACPASDITLYRGRGACPAYDRASFREGVLLSASGVTADGEGVVLARSAGPLDRRKGDPSGRSRPRQRCVISSAQPNGLGTYTKNTPALKGRDKRLSTRADERGPSGRMNHDRLQTQGIALGSGITARWAVLPVEDSVPRRLFLSPVEVVCLAGRRWLLITPCGSFGAKAAARR